MTVSGVPSCMGSVRRAQEGAAAAHPARHGDAAGQQGGDALPAFGRLRVRPPRHAVRPAEEVRLVRHHAPAHRVCPALSHRCSVVLLLVNLIGQRRIERIYFTSATIHGLGWGWKEMITKSNNKSTKSSEPPSTSKRCGGFPCAIQS